MSSSRAKLAVIVSILDKSEKDISANDLAFIINFWLTILPNPAVFYEAAAGNAEWYTNNIKIITGVLEARKESDSSTDIANNIISALKEFTFEDFVKEMHDDPELRKAFVNEVTKQVSAVAAKIKQQMDDDDRRIKDAYPYDHIRMDREMCDGPRVPFMDAEEVERIMAANRDNCEK